VNRRRQPLTAAQVVALYEDVERCADVAGLRYVSVSEPGIRRRRCGRGFSYRSADDDAVAADVRSWIEQLAIPPAWHDVWICPDRDGHLLAVGQDDRGRTQYLYHERWRALRDLLNFYRLSDVGRHLPAVRADVDAQLRRRTLDRERVLAAMLRIIDRCGLRVGNEVYAEENDSFGLSTLTRRHVQVRASTVSFDFPAKSGQHTSTALDDRAVARVVTALLERRGRRVFALDGSPLSADDVNARLAELTDSSVTAKDFRTWRGTLVAFEALRSRPAQASDLEHDVLDAIDAAAHALGNTRAVARAHYVHPQLIDSYLTGRFRADLAARGPSRLPGLTAGERRLLPLLDTLLDRGLAGPGAQTDPGRRPATPRV
jgi:DNA topoisomerase-1